MTNDDFMKVFDETVEKCRELLEFKNTEYSRGGDKLHTFKRAARFQTSIPEHALMGMAVKHIVNIFDYLDDFNLGIEHLLEEWDAKLIDVINYLILLRALLIEREEIKRGETKCGKP